MKNIFITTAMLFTAFIAFSQNVGIGENAPATKLEIKGDAGTDLLNIKTSTGASRLYVEEGGSIGIGTNNPDNSAILDIQSTNKGVLFPRLSTAQRASVTPSEGMTIFNTTTNCMDVYSGGAWKSLCPCNAAPTQPGTISGTATNLCRGSTGNTYSVAAVPGATFYQWTVPANFTIASGQGTNSISVSLASNAANGTITVVAGNGCGLSISRTLDVTVVPGGAANFTTVTTGQNWQVPACVTSITVRAWGAGGGAGGDGGGTGGGGGGGGYVRGTITVSPNETLNIRVGGGGAYMNAASGTNGGGAGGGSSAGRGGGYSAVFRGTTALVVAGGGGGGNRCNSGNWGLGGGGGGTTGGSGKRGCGQGNADIATGGTQIAGGVSGTACGVSGAYLTGGTGCTNNFFGGGGGGGYYGGGGGPQDGAGGGGSSFTGGLSSAQANEQGLLGTTVQNTFVNPGGTSDIHWSGLGSPGRGGSRPNNGTNGAVRIEW
jgi:hypothetical protein